MAEQLQTVALEGGVWVIDANGYVATAVGPTGTAAVIGEIMTIVGSVPIDVIEGTIKRAREARHG